MFLGEYTYRVDEKGRIPLPPKYREEFCDGTIVTRGVEKCITVYPSPQWQKLAKTLAGQSVPRSKMRKFNRVLFGEAFSLTLDRQGRFSLPSPLQEYAEIEDTAVIIGANNYLEIWQPDNWQKARDEAEEEAWQITESIEAE